MATRFVRETQWGVQPTFAGTAEEIRIKYVMKIGGKLISEVAGCVKFLMSLFEPNRFRTHLRGKNCCRVYMDEACTYK